MIQADSVFSSHPNMHRSGKIRTPCPNMSAAVHVEDEGAKEWPRLTVDQMRGRLYLTDLRPGGAVPSAANELGRRYRVDSDELLQGAVVRALGQRTRRPDLPAEMFLAQIMRSVGSSIARARLRARHREEDFRYSLTSQCGRTRVGLSADEFLQLDAEQHYYSGLLDEVANGDELLERLIDGIGFGMRGADLAEFLKISQPDLASHRRTLKRRAQTIAHREKLLPENGTAVEGGENA